MKLTELVNAPDQDWAAIEIKPDCKYVIFADPARVNLDDLWHSLCDASIQGCLVAAWKPSNGAIRDVVAAFALTPSPADDPELPSAREEVAQIGRQIDSGAQDSIADAS